MIEFFTPLFPILSLFTPFPLELIHAVWPTHCQNQTRVVSETKTVMGALPIRPDYRKDNASFPEPGVSANLLYGFERFNGELVVSFANGPNLL
jgi:hypothetical protein